MIKALFFPQKSIAIAFTALIFCIIVLATLTPLPQAVSVPGSDKWHHFLAFAALTYPLATLGGRSCVWVIFFALGFGGAIEIIQPYVNRSAEFADFAADATGAMIGCALGLMAARFRS